jgi:hypothetical protein
MNAMSSRFVFLSLSGVEFINHVANKEKSSLRLHWPIEGNKAAVVQRNVLPVVPETV